MELFYGHEGRQRREGDGVGDGDRLENVPSFVITSNLLFSPCFFFFLLTNLHLRSCEASIQRPVDSKPRRLKARLISRRQRDASSGECLGCFFFFFYLNSRYYYYHYNISREKLLISKKLIPAENEKRNSGIYHQRRYQQ